MSERDIIVLPNPAITARHILATVAQRHELTVEILKSATRTQRVSIARDEACWEIRTKANKSLPWIGDFMGGRDHTTVLASVRRHEARLAEAQERAA